MPQRRAFVSKTETGNPIISGISSLRTGCLLFVAIGLTVLFPNRVFGQCTITGTVDASSLTCATTPLNGCGGILYIGDGITPTTLNMNADLNLTCLGSIQFIISNNATLDFNKNGQINLQLGSGSEFIIQPSGNLNNSGNCGGDHTITIGSDKYASCNGNASDFQFSNLKCIPTITGNLTICSGSTSQLTGSGTPALSVPWTSGSTSVATVSNTGQVTAFAVGTSIITYMNISGCSKTVTVTVNPTPVITAMIATKCSGFGFTSLPVNGTNGVVPSTTTYSWPLPVVTGGITGGAAGTASANVFGTLSNPGNIAQTATYTVTPASGGCSGSTFTVTLTVKPLPKTSAIYHR